MASRIPPVTARSHVPGHMGSAPGGKSMVKDNITLLCSMHVGMSQSDANLNDVKMQEGLEHGNYVLWPSPHAGMLILEQSSTSTGSC